MTALPRDRIPPKGSRLSAIAGSHLFLEFNCGHQVVKAVEDIDAEDTDDVKARAICKECNDSRGRREHVLHLRIVPNYKGMI